MTLSEISAHWMDWRECVKMAKQEPYNELRQWWAAKAQMKLVCCQAQYFAEVKA